VVGGGRSRKAVTAAVAQGSTIGAAAAEAAPRPPDGDLGVERLAEFQGAPHHHRAIGGGEGTARAGFGAMVNSADAQQGKRQAGRIWRLDIIFIDIFLRAPRKIRDGLN